jgi:hypothetical protein
MIQDVYPGCGFFPIPDPRVEKTLDPGSGSVVFIREMENISRRSAIGDCVTILTERLIKDVTVSRLHSTRV